MSGSFIVVNRPKKGAVRQSSLFKLMQSNEARWRDLIKVPAKNIQSPDSYIPAYLINLEFDTAKNIHTGYTMCDRHIRIDEEFGTQNSVLANKKLCTHWHYTERFKKGNDTITIHAYYHYNTMLGVYKRINNDEHLLVTDVDLLSAVQHNSSPAREKVYQLIDLLKQERAAAESQYNKLIAQMPDIQAHDSTSVDTLRKHLEQCKAASERLNDLNEDYSDVRILMIERSINMVIAAKQSQHVKQKPIVHEEETIAPAVVAAEAAVNTNGSNKNKDAVVKQLNLNIEVEKHLNEYKNASVAKLIKLASIKQDLQFEVVAQYFTAKDQSIKLQLLKFEKQLQELPKLIDILMQKCTDSDAVAIKALYTAIDSNEIPDGFYFELLEKILTKRLDEQQSLAFEDLLKFLYATSDKYRLLITYIANLGYIQHIDEPVLRYSYIFSLYIEEIKNNANHVIFKCLINQLGVAQQYGLVYGKHNVSLLTAIASRDIDGEIMEFLISKGFTDSEVFWLVGAKFLTSYKELGSSKENDTLRKMLPETKLGQRSVATTSVDAAAYNDGRHYISQFASINSGLFAYAIHDGTNNINVYNKLLETSNDMSMLLSISAIVARYRMMMLPSWGSKDKYKLYTDSNERARCASEHVQRVCDEADSNGTDFLKFYLILRKPDPSGFTDRILQSLVAKVATMSTERIMHAYEKCMRNGIEASCAKNSQLALTCFYAALHALNSVTPQTAEIHQKVFKLFGRLIHAHEDDTNSQFVTEKAGYVAGHKGAMKNMLAASKFRGALQNETGAPVASKLKPN